MTARSKRKETGSGGRIALCALLLVAILACAAPGEGRKAAEGMALCQPVIDALQAYHDGEGGSYPETLSTLVPGYIAEIPETFDNFPIVYRRTETGYELTFSYQRPGMNECTYTPDPGWACTGYF